MRDITPITTKNFVIERNELWFVATPDAMVSDQMRVASRDRRFHHWTLAGMRKFLVNFLNEENVTQPDREMFDMIFKSKEFTDWVNPQVASWMRKQENLLWI